MSEHVVRIIKRTVVALVAVIGAVVVRAICHSVFDETIPYTPFYPAIVIATMYGRLPGGLIAIALAGVAASFWISPIGQAIIEEPTDFIELFLFLGVAGVIVGLCESMRRAQHSAETATEEQRAAAAREHAARLEAEEANRLKDQFLACASHELRTPLQAILGWAHLLRRTEIDEHERAEGLDVIECNARAQSRLVEDLLDMSRIVAGKMRISPRFINPKQVLEAAIQTVSIAAQAKQISIVRCYEEIEIALWADPDRMQQVAWNLLSNAIKFSPAGSTVRVDLRQLNGEVVIEVADEGQGIDPEFLPHVFESFRQADMTGSRRHSGLGLGLSIAKQLIELHGGQIAAASPGAGQGSRFLLTFPIVKEGQTTQPWSPIEHATKTQRGVRILVVDDDAAACNLTARILRQRHSEVVTVTSVDEALAVMSRFEPDVIVSDIAMPERDGYELLRCVRAREHASKQRVRALALTALASPEDQRRALEAGYRLHLAKPADPSALFDAVDQLSAV